MKCVKLISALLAMAVLCISISAMAQFQQPTPGEAEVGAKPTPTYPQPRSSAMRAADLAVFAAILAVGTFAIVRLQSRRAMLVLLGVSLIYFGFWRNGCVCSVGAIQNTALSLADSGYTISIFITIIFLLPIAFSLLFGRIFCGSLCPLGAFQEWINPTRFHLRIPRKLDIALGYLRWVYLVAAIWFAIGGLAIWGLNLKSQPRFIICMLDPIVNVFRMVNLRAIGTEDAQIFSVPATVLGWPLAAFMIAVSVVIIRPYCRWLCPYGAILGTCSRAAKWPVALSPSLCPDCKICEPACPVNAIDSGVIDPVRCVACGRCHKACPVKRSERGLTAGKPLSEFIPAKKNAAAPIKRSAVDPPNIQRLEDKIELDYLDKLLADAASGQGGQLQLLMAIQQQHGYLPAEALDYAADRSSFTTAELLEISSFYNMFRHEPVGKHVVSVCHGTACHVAGAQMVTDALRRHLSIPEGRQTDAKREFTVEKISCLGCCSLAPVMQVDSITYGHLTGESACEIIDKIATGKIKSSAGGHQQASDGDCKCGDSCKGGGQ